MADMRLPHQEAIDAAERRVERALFASRWLVVPFYLGLLGALALLFAAFMRELIKYSAKIATIDSNTAILAALTLIDLALVANLVIIVVLASYETMVSKINTPGERPEWMGALGFSDVKLKLFASIVAISGIQLLKVLMEFGGPTRPDPEVIYWLTLVHIAFVVTSVLSALTDWLGARSKAMRK
jgi:uncharacterized protein (TIGR00645 family)